MEDAVRTQSAFNNASTLETGIAGTSHSDSRLPVLSRPRTGKPAAFLKSCLPSFSWKTRPPEEIPPNVFESLRKVEDYPVGYPLFAAYLSSDPDFAIVRAFRSLRSRTILLKQSELADLEAALDRNEAAVPKPNDDDECGTVLQSRDFYETDHERANLLEKITKALKEYDGMIESMAKVLSFRKARKRNFESLQNFLYHYAPLIADDANSLKNRHDFIELSTNDDVTRVDHWTETIVKKTWLGKILFQGPKYNTLSQSEVLHIYSAPRIRFAGRVFITAISVCSLLGPIVALDHIDKPSTRLWSLCLFTFTFALAILVFTGARKHEVFASTAAYCAVLVVFIGSRAETVGTEVPSPK